MWVADFIVDTDTEYNQKWEWSAVSYWLYVYFVVSAQRMHAQEIRFLEGFIYFAGFFGIHSFSNWHHWLCSESCTSNISGAVLCVVLQCSHVIVVWHDDCRGTEDPCEILLKSLAAAQAKCSTDDVLHWWGWGTSKEGKHWHVPQWCFPACTKRHIAV